MGTCSRRDCQTNSHHGRCVVGYICVCGFVRAWGLGIVTVEYSYRRRDESAVIWPSSPPSRSLSETSQSLATISVPEKTQVEVLRPRDGELNGVRWRIMECHSVHSAISYQPVIGGMGTSLLFGVVSRTRCNYHHLPASHPLFARE